MFRTIYVIIITLLACIMPFFSDIIGLVGALGEGILSGSRYSRAAGRLAATSQDRLVLDCLQVFGQPRCGFPSFSTSKSSSRAAP